jgi:pyruvate/2-oxoglutarate dehydrogenase complex dihydrolipoamide dehydrogenase (E3) component
VLNRSTVARVEGRRAFVQTPEGGRTFEVERILVAAGRRPRVDGLGLEAIGVKVDERGVHVSRACRTSVPSIWAVGDVTETYRFTHWGSHQARLVVRNALLPGSAQDEREILPWTTFTQPEVARLGLSEDEAQKAGIAYDIHRAPFDEVDRAVCDAETEGFAKVLTRKGSGRILGAAIVHDRAGELIAELTLAKRSGVPLGKLGSLIHVYPTLAEVHGAMADAHVLGRLVRFKPILARIFAWWR